MVGSWSHDLPFSHLSYRHFIHRKYHSDWWFIILFHYVMFEEEEGVAGRKMAFTWKT